MLYGSECLAVKKQYAPPYDYFGMRIRWMCDKVKTGEESENVERLVMVRENNIRESLRRFGHVYKKPKLPKYE